MVTLSHSLFMSVDHAPSSLNISVLQCWYDFEPPPSMQYDASVNGAPAKPMSGMLAGNSWRIMRTASGTKCSGSMFSRAVMASISADVRIGL